MIGQVQPAPTPATPPDPTPTEAPDAGADAVAKDMPPTRYGDWEKNGRCIDF
jgi:hypothetical protein